MSTSGYNTSQVTIEDMSGDMHAVGHAPWRSLKVLSVLCLCLPPWCPGKKQRELN